MDTAYLRLSQQRRSSARYTRRGKVYEAHKLRDLVREWQVELNVRDHSRTWLFSFSQTEGHVLHAAVIMHIDNDFIVSDNPNLLTFRAFLLPPPPSKFFRKQGSAPRAPVDLESN
jgi:hypothetical protein